MNTFCFNSSSLAARLLASLLTSACVLALALPTTAQRYRFVSLHPAGFAQSVAVAAGSGKQVGYAFQGYDRWFKVGCHAMLWHGSAAGPTDLHPSYSLISEATAVRGNVTLGYAWVNGQEHAYRWDDPTYHGTDIHPAGYRWSTAVGAVGENVVGNGDYEGEAFPASNGWIQNEGGPMPMPHYLAREYSYVWGACGERSVGYVWQPDYADYAVTEKRAAVWRNTTDMPTILRAPGFYETQARATDGRVQSVGFGCLRDGNNHALLWNYIDVTDLHPMGFTSSGAFAVSWLRQAGFGVGSATNGCAHALVWAGWADRYMDLHRCLPAGYVVSRALAWTNSATSSVRWRGRRESPKQRCG